MDAFKSGLACYCHQSQNEVNRIRRFSQSIDSHWKSKANRLDSELEKGRLSKVEKCLQYLETNAHLSLAGCKEEADAMIVAYKLRNQIIHNNGKVTDRFEKQKAQWKGLVKGSLGSYIEIDSKFVAWYLEQVASFYHKLAPEVSSFIQRTKIA